MTQKDHLRHSRDLWISGDLAVILDALLTANHRHTHLMKTVSREPCSHWSGLCCSKWCTWHLAKLVPTIRFFVVLRSKPICLEKHHTEHHLVGIGVKNLIQRVYIYNVSLAVGEYQHHSSNPPRFLQDSYVITHGQARKDSQETLKHTTSARNPNRNPSECSKTLVSVMPMPMVKNCHFLSCW